MRNERDDTNHQASSTQYVVHGLGDVGRVQVVVVGITVPAVTLLDPAEKGLEHAGRHFELVYHTVPIQEVVTQVLYRLSHARLAQREYVEGPFVQCL